MKSPTWRLSLLLTCIPFAQLATAQDVVKPRVVPEEAPEGTLRPKVVSDETAPAPAPRVVEQPTPATPNKGGNNIRPSGGPDEDLYNYASMLYTRGAALKEETAAIQTLGLAIESFGKYVASYPNGKRLDAVLTYKAEAHFKRREFTQAMDCYQQVAKSFKSGLFFVHCTRQLATLYFNDPAGDRLAEAVKYFNLAASQSANPEEKVLLRHYMGLASWKLGKKKEAVGAWELNAKASGLSNTLRQDQSLLELGRYELDNKLKTARSRFERIAASNNATGPLKAEAYYSLGSLDLDEKKPEEAQKNFEACAKIPAVADPSVSKWAALARSALIRSYAVAGEYKKVTDAWVKMDIQDTPPEGRAQLILAVADAYRQQQVYGSAIDLYNMLEKHHESAAEASEAAYRKLFCLYKVKDPNTDTTAYQLLERLKEKDPKSPYIDMVRLMRAEDAFNRKKWDLASQSYKEVKSENIDEKLRGSFFYRKGRAAAENGQHAVAVESLGEFIAGFPTDPLLPEVMFRRGQSYVELKDLTNGQRDYDAVVERFPSNPMHEEAYRVSALLRGTAKDYNGLVQRFNEMLTAHPKSKYKGEANFWIGTGHYFLKQYRECLEPLSYAASTYVEMKEDALQKRIMAFAQLEDLESLGKEIDAFYAGGPKSTVPADILAYLGGKRYTEQNYKEAAKYLGLAVEAPSKTALVPAAWFQLADARLQIGNYQGVVDASTKYLEVAGKLPSDRKCRVHLIRGRAFLNMKKTAEALENANDGIKLQVEGPNQSRLLHLRGDIKLSEGDAKEAANNYGVVANLGPYDEIAADAIRKLIQIFEKAGDAAEVRKYREKFKAEFPNEPDPPVTPASPSA
jgi:TolA-binding protein